ncbi:MAG: aminopeptidase P family protein, partial [Porphyromonadaceae bacterium]|nr:aminopeptidase P family protein [Porphyromonadaceae bacterium]
VVVTTAEAGLWTDSRYFLQAAEELQASGLQLFKEGLPDTPSMTEWIVCTLPAGATVAIDGTTCSFAEGERWKAFFTAKGLHFKTDFTPFEEIWKGRPAVPADAAFVYPVKYSGRSFSEKWEDVRKAIAERGAKGILICALDELAWLLNIRGNDVEYNPVVVGFAYFSTTRRVLFLDKGKITADLATYLQENEIEQQPYEAVDTFLQGLPADERVFVDPMRANYRLTKLLVQQQNAVLGPSPITWLKSIKNKTEMEGRRAAMVRDGAAMVQFLYWLDTHIGKEEITEIGIAEKLREFRGRQPLYKGESFGTIAGYREHGAIVHYSASPESNSRLSPKGFLLVDSGAQYLDGTTDITRTIVLGPLTEEERRDYTLVLKGHIGIATAIFPEGTRGDQIDVLARRHLWNVFRNYLHGTGHGVGHFLNVHEGPQNIRLEQNNTPLVPGMVTSNEPGIYLAGRYGIRTENLTLVVEAGESEFGHFYRFETLTLCPIDKRAIDKNLLTSEEVAWLDAYHRMVYDRVSPLLDETHKAWLRNATAPL